MANYATLKAAIQNVVKTNGNNEITGALLQQTLFAMVNSLGADYQFIGVALPTTNPGTPDQNVFYISGCGTFPNFNGATIPDGHIGIFKYNGQWVVDSVVIGYARTETLSNWINGSLNLSGAYISDSTRIIGTVDVSKISGATLELVVGNGYNVSVRMLRIENFENPTEITGAIGDNIIFQTGWVSSGVYEIPNGVISLIIIARKTDNTSIVPTDASNIDITIVGTESLTNKFDSLRNDIGELSPIKTPYGFDNWINGGLTSGNIIGYQANPTRLIATCSVTENDVFEYACVSGFSVAIRFLTQERFENPNQIANINVNTDVLIRVGWVTNGKLTVPVGAKSSIVLLRKDDNSNITPQESINASFYKVEELNVVEQLDSLRTSIEEKTLPISGIKEIDSNISNWVNGSLDPNLAYINTNNRVIGTIRIIGGVASKLRFSGTNGLEFSVRLVDFATIYEPTQIVAFDQNKIVAQITGWVSDGSLSVPENTKSAIIIARKQDNSNITPDFAFQNSDIIVEVLGLEKEVEYNTEMSKPETLPSGYYSGERLFFGNNQPYYVDLWKTFELPRYAQSLAIYGDYIVFFYGNGGSSGSIWQISTGQKIADLSFSYGEFTIPHGNVMCFGNQFADGNTVLPLLYLSQWDGNGGCLVYDVRLDGTCNLVQTIMVNGMSQDVYGSDLGDWVVDTRANLIYSVKYHNNSAIPSQTNYDNICAFRLPRLSEGQNIVFTPNDIISYFSIPFTPISQDKKIMNGRMFIAAGNPSYSGSQKIFVVDITRMGIISIFDVSNIGRTGGDEPEGIAIIENGIVLGLGYQPTQFYLLKC